jgi:tetratricopeptide (TPR) repeat protein
LSVSLRLLDAASGKVLLQKRARIAASASSPQAIARLAAPALSSALDGVDLPDGTQRDPALLNKTSAEYLRAADDFEGRRGKADLDHALEAIERALAVEPSSALARARFVAIAVTRLSYAQSSPELLAKAERYGAEAVRLHPDLAEVHRALSGLFYAKGDLARSGEEALEAIEIAGPQDGPLLALAWTAKLLGRPDLAIRWHRLAMQLEEHPADFEFSYADCLTDLGQDEEARQIYQRVSDLHPDLPEGWVGLCRLRLLAGDVAGARKIYLENLGSFAQFPFAMQMAAQVEFFSRQWPEAEKLYRKLAETDPEGGREFYGEVTYPSALGRLRQLAAGTEASTEILAPALAEETALLQAAPQNPRILYRVAALEASLGREPEALAHLRAAAEGGQLDYRSLRQDPRFDSLQPLPEFDRICAAMAARVGALRKTTADRLPTGSPGEKKHE